MLLDMLDRQLSLVPMRVCRLEEGGALEEGLGVIMWVDATGMLGIGDLNASTVALAEGGTGWGGMSSGTGRRGGSIQARRSLALSSSETCLQVVSCLSPWHCHPAKYPPTPRVLLNKIGIHHADSLLELLCDPASLCLPLLSTFHPSPCS